MDAIALVVNFVEHAVAVDRRDRLAGFAGKASTRAKFLATLDHALAKAIDESLVVASLAPGEWNEASLLYASDGSFGAPAKSLREGYDRASPHGGWLLLSASGRVAILRPEGRIDDERFLRF